MNPNTMADNISSNIQWCFSMKKFMYLYKFKLYVLKSKQEIEFGSLVTKLISAEITELTESNRLS